MAKDPKLDCYATLGVHPNAEDVVIRAAFKALAQRYHPDRFSGSKDEAHRRMSDLTSAYEVLADPVRRRKYDRRRRIYARTASFYIKDPSRDRHSPFAIVNHVSMAARQRRYRVALSALMAAVIVLTAFNIYQYSGRLKEWLGSSPSAPPIAADAKRRSAPEASIPATAGAAPSDPPPDASAAKARSAPIGQGVTRAIGPNPAAAQVSPASPTDAAPAPETPLSATAALIPARPPAADPNREVTAPVAVPQAVATLRKETKPAPAKPAVAKNAPANRPGATSPAPVASEPCSDVVAALGLCKPNSTDKGK
jgi:curved DNA-binding protein CbpA